MTASSCAMKSKRWWRNKRRNATLDRVSCRWPNNKCDGGHRECARDSAQRSPQIVASSLRHSIQTGRFPQRLPTQPIAFQENSIHMAKVGEILGHIPIHEDNV